MVGEGYGVFKFKTYAFMANTTFSWQSNSATTPYFIRPSWSCTNPDYLQIVAHSLVEWEKPDESTSNGSFA